MVRWRWLHKEWMSGRNKWAKHNGWWTGRNGRDTDVIFKIIHFGKASKFVNSKPTSGVLKDAKNCRRIGRLQIHGEESFRIWVIKDFNPDYSRQRRWVTAICRVIKKPRLEEIVIGQITFYTKCLKVLWATGSNVVGSGQAIVQHRRYLKVISRLEAENNEIGVNTGSFQILKIQPLRSTARSVGRFGCCHEGIIQLRELESNSPSFYRLA